MATYEVVFLMVKPRDSSVSHGFTGGVCPLGPFWKFSGERMREVY
jgi:hypothetical protein